MKRILFFLSLFVAVSLQAQVIFQSDFETWSAGVPTGWNGSQTNIGATNYVQYTTSAHGGTSACQLINAGGSHLRFATVGQSVDIGVAYDITFWVRGQGEMRTGFFNGVDAGANIYNSYINVNTTTWTQHTQTIISPVTAANAQFIFSLRNTNVANDHLQIDDVVIQVSSATLDTVSIYNIQYTTDPSGDSPYKDSTIATYGVVTAFKTGGFYIQDGVGPWSGLYIYNNTFTVAPGDSILVVGRIVEYYEMTEMTQVTLLTVLGTAPIPAPSVITTAQANTEEYESVLVKVMNAACTNANAGFGMWVVNDGSGTILIDKLFYEHTPTLGVNYNVTGPTMYSFDEFRIEPRNAADVEVYTSVEEVADNSVRIFPNPATDIARITFSGTKDVAVTNILGQTVFTEAEVSGELLLNVSLWENGIYLVTVTSASGQRTVYKLLKN
jgi:hypothetical protein